MGLEAPRCNRSDKFCPAFPGVYQAQTEAGLAEIGRQVLEAMETTTPVSLEHAREMQRQIEKVRQDMNGHRVKAEVSNRELDKLRASGQLCDICPHR